MASCFHNLLLLLLLLSVTVTASDLDQYCNVGDGDSLKILIKGGTVVNAHLQEVADVYVENGIIAAVRPNIEAGHGVCVLDAKGKFVMPGGIDPHTHLDAEPGVGMKSVDDFFSGQAAALAGGTTMHIDFAVPVNGSLIAGFEAYRKKAKVSCMDYGFHMIINKWDENVSDEMETLVNQKGVNSFKFFMAYKGYQVDDELLLKGLRRCKSLGSLAMVHAENGDAVIEGQNRMIELGITGPEGHPLSRPPVVEAEATSRAIRLAGFVKTPLYVVHVTSIDAMEEVAAARKSGQRVIGEPIISGLLLNDSVYWHPDFAIAAKYVMSPPIRTAGHDKALQAALSRGVLQLVGTDHCAMDSKQRALGIDDFRKILSGVNGIEERMHLVWDTMVETGQISVTDYVRITSTECAKIFNIYPRKGAILPGSDADIIILDPNSSFQISAKSHHSNLDTNIYEGWSGKGKIEVTIARGRVVWINDELRVEPGSGQYVNMPPFSYLFEGIDKEDAMYLSSLQAPVKRTGPTK